MPIYTYIHTYLPTDIQTYIHTYIHTYMYIYIYIHTASHRLSLVSNFIPIFWWSTYEFNDFLINRGAERSHWVVLEPSHMIWWSQWARKRRFSRIFACCFTVLHKNLLFSTARKTQIHRSIPIPWASGRNEHANNVSKPQLHWLIAQRIIHKKKVTCPGMVSNSGETVSSCHTACIYVFLHVAIVDTYYTFLYIPPEPYVLCFAVTPQASRSGQSLKFLNPAFGRSNAF